MEIQLNGGLKTFFNLVNKMPLSKLSSNYLYIKMDDSLKFIVNNLESMVVYDAPYSGDSENFEVAVPLAPLKPLVDNGLENAFFSIEKDLVVINQGNRKYSFDIIESAVPEFELNDLNELIVPRFGLLCQFARLAEGNESKPMFNGVNVVSRNSELVFQASNNGYTFHQHKEDFQEDVSLLFPSHFLHIAYTLVDEMVVSDSVSIEYNSRFFVLSAEGFTVASRALGYRFPEISDSMFNKDLVGDRLVSRKELLGAVTRCYRSASNYIGQSASIKMNMKSSNIVISNHIIDDRSKFRLEESISCDVTHHADGELVLNPELLKNILISGKSQDVSMRYNKNLCVFEDQDFIHVIAGIAH